MVTAHRDLLAGLGVNRAKPITLMGAPVPGTNIAARWSAPMQVAGLLKGKGAHQPHAVHRAAERHTRRRGETRRRVVFAMAFDPVAGDWAGYEFLPTIGRDVAVWTHAPQGPQPDRRRDVLRPGSLTDDLKKHPEWSPSASGDVRAVQIAGWNFGFRDPANDFDYAALISRTCTPAESSPTPGSSRRW